MERFGGEKNKDIGEQARVISRCEKGSEMFKEMKRENKKNQMEVAIKGETEKEREIKRATKRDK